MNMMMKIQIMTAIIPPMEDIIREKLTKALGPQILEIVDRSLEHAGHAGMPSNGSRGTHFHARIVSEVFAPLSRLERHRIVHEILKAEIGQIHALSLNLQSPQDI